MNSVNTAQDDLWRQSRMKIHHIGIATKRLAMVRELYVELFTANVIHSEELDGMYIEYLSIGDDYLELLEPVDDEGPIATYLTSRESGIHHIALETPDIESALENVRSHGVQLVDEQPRPGAWGHSVAFLHPKSTGGILFEFVQE